MTTTLDTTARDTKARRDKRPERLSSDGKWRSFPKVPNLLQYVSTGLYFARVKVNGKLFRQGLGTHEFETARLRLHDYILKQTKRRRTVGAPVTFKDARLSYEIALNHNHALQEASRYYRQNCIKRLLASWPGLDDVRLSALQPHDCEEWAGRLAAEIDPQYFNNILGSFKAILSRAGYDDTPLNKIKRLGIPTRELTLPEPDQFLRLLAAMETSGAGQAQHCADFARFLAFSGCRLSEARKVTWADVDMVKGFILVQNAKTRRAKNHRPTRSVPIVPDMRELLTRLKASNPPADSPVCQVFECDKSLARACKIVGVPRLTHHDLRHLFATRCIEAGVDIPTVSRWLGHSDGGALAMRVYGHLREKHSTTMATMVTFRGSQKEGA